MILIDGNLSCWSTNFISNRQNTLINKLNSIFIGLDGGFAPWVGAVLSDIDQQILLVVDENRIDEAITRLSRVGFDNVKGYLKGGFSSWQNHGKEVAEIETVSANDFNNNYSSDNVNVFDVRKLTEYQSEHLLEAINIPLNNIHNFISDFNVDGENYIHCAGGYRSMIANSILKSHGIHKLVAVSYTHLTLPTNREV